MSDKPPTQYITVKGFDAAMIQGLAEPWTEESILALTLKLEGGAQQWDHIAAMDEDLRRAGRLIRLLVAACKAMQEQLDRG